MQPDSSSGFSYLTPTAAEDGRTAARLVAQMTVAIGLLLVVVGLSRTYAVYAESRRGLETLATIDAAAIHRLDTGGSVDLSWRDAGGATRQAFGVEVTSDLGRKLRLGNPLVRAQLRIRYRPDSPRATVLVIEDVPPRIKRASALSIAGFFAITAGSLIMLWLSLQAAAAFRDDGP